ncbi:MAG: hypothetical protein EXR55_00075 [Dehalococcoidia bacterium]|nr:hypothetical protein [Dehalococcoidia bacterium]
MSPPCQPTLRQYTPSLALSPAGAWVGDERRRQRPAQDSLGVGLGDAESLEISEGQVVSLKELA